MGRDDCTAVTRLAKVGGSTDSSSRGSLEVQISRQRDLVFRIVCKQNMLLKKESYLVGKSLGQVAVNVLPQVMLPFLRLVPVPHTEEATNATHVGPRVASATGSAQLFALLVTPDMSPAQ